jgi:hypothetical protein
MLWGQRGGHHRRRQQFVDRMEKQNSAVLSAVSGVSNQLGVWKKWSRWGCDFHKAMMPQPIIHAVAFDPDA